jgi:hypothetical protein
VSAVLYGIVVVVVLLREECGVAGLETGGRALQRLNGAIVSSLEGAASWATTP